MKGITLFLILFLTGCQSLPPPAPKKDLGRIVFEELQKELNSDYWKARTAYEQERWLAEQDRKNRLCLPQVCIGMKSEFVLQSSWGDPQTVNRITSNKGIEEIWVYPNRGKIYLLSGVVYKVDELIVK